MQLKRRVALGGVQLDSLDNRILITGIDEAAGRETISAVSLGGAPGQRVTNRRRDTLDITVKFAMNIKNSDMSGRSTLLDKVNAWARPGGWLTVGHRSGKRLYVALAQAPGGGDQFNWTNDYTVVFRAYETPFWEDTTAVTDSAEGTSCSGTVTVPGSAETVAEVTVKNLSANPLTTVSLSVNGHTMAFSGLSIATNGTLVIDHERSGGAYFLRAKVGSASVLAKKTGADEFVCQPGNNSWSSTTNVNALVTVSVKGRYL
jgi:hypothetical protein